MRSSGHVIQSPKVIHGIVPVFVYSNASVPVSLTEIEFGRAAHRIAYAVRPSRQGPDGEVVVIIAYTDTITYQAVVVDLSIAG